TVTAWPTRVPRSGHRGVRITHGSWGRRSDEPATPGPVGDRGAAYHDGLYPVSLALPDGAFRFLRATLVPYRASDVSAPLLPRPAGKRSHLNNGLARQTARRLVVCVVYSACYTGKSRWRGT